MMKKRKIITHLIEWGSVLVLFAGLIIVGWQLDKQGKALEAQYKIGSDEWYFARDSFNIYFHLIGSIFMCLAVTALFAIRIIFKKVTKKIKLKTIILAAALAAYTGVIILFYCLAQNAANHTWLGFAAIPLHLPIIFLSYYTCRESKDDDGSVACGEKPQKETSV